MHVLWIGFAALFVSMAPNAADAPPATASPAAAGTPAPDDPCANTLALVSRPSVTTAACAVPRDRVLIESGYQNTTADGAPSLVQYPQALVRVGSTVRGLEIDLGPPMLERTPGATGTSDTTFGLKYQFAQTGKAVASVNGFIAVPSGTNGYSAGGYGYTGNVNLSYSLTPGLGVAGTLSYNAIAANSLRYTSIVPSVVLSGSVTASTTVFGEVATFSHALGPLSPTRVQYLVGASQALANKLQFDIAAGRSPTAATGRYRYVGAGLSYFF